MKRTPAVHLPAIAALIVATSSAAIATVPAYADTPTCDGEPATIVGPGPGNVTHGTPGDDVIVTVAEAANGNNGGVYTYDGNDTVCIIPGTAPVPHPDAPNGFTINTGPGNDKVFNQDPRNTSDLTIVLGLGADTFGGNDRTERVWAGETATTGWLGPDDTQDTITTAGGNDLIRTGTPGAPNTDIISTGAGYDEITHAGTGTSIDNGDDADHLNLIGTDWKQRLVIIDNRTETATADSGEFLRWTNAYLFHVVGDSPLRFVGTEARDILHLTSTLAPNARASVPVEATMNGGDDIFWFSNGIAPGRVDGGAGLDHLTPESQDACTDVTATFNDAYTCTIETPGPAPGTSTAVTYNVALTGWEDYATFNADRNATITGTNGRDKIHVYAAHARVRGLRGNDLIAATRGQIGVRAILRGDQGADRLYGGDTKDTLLGGRGNDNMFGRGGRDTLRGGKGYDRARGMTGRDTCTAEVRRSCER